MWGIKKELRRFWEWRLFEVRTVRQSQSAALNALPIKKQRAPPRYIGEARVI
jgi:hypothetical protein